MLFWFFGKSCISRSRTCVRALLYSSLFSKETSPLCHLSMKMPVLEYLNAALAILLSYSFWSSWTFLMIDALDFFAFSCGSSLGFATFCCALIRFSTIFRDSGGSSPKRSSSMTQTSTVAEFAIIERFDLRSVVFYILADSVVWRELCVIFVVYVEPRLL